MHGEVRHGMAATTDGSGVNFPAVQRFVRSPPSGKGAIPDTGLRQARKSGVPERPWPPVSGVANRRSQPPHMFPTCPGKSLSSAHTGTAMKLGHLGRLFSTPTRTRKKRYFQKPLFFRVHQRTWKKVSKVSQFPSCSLPCKKPVSGRTPAVLRIHYRRQCRR